MAQPPSPERSNGGPLAPLPKITPHALRRTYISLMLEAGAPLPYVMDQVGHADSKTTLEIYAQVQKRISRKNAHAACDEASGRGVPMRERRTAVVSPGRCFLANVGLHQ